MALTPLLVVLFARLTPKPIVEKPAYDHIDEDDTPRVIIAGFGRVGQIVARILRANQIRFTAIESSIEQVEFSRRFGSQIYYGDPTRSDLLRAAHVDKAELFIVATDDPETNIRTARLVRRMYPHLKVIARARNRQHAFRLMDLGADVVRETFHSSLECRAMALEQLGMRAGTGRTTRRALPRVRREAARRTAPVLRRRSRDHAERARGPARSRSPVRGRHRPGAAHRSKEAAS